MPAGKISWSLNSKLCKLTTARGLGSTKMQDKELLLELLAADEETDAIWALQKRGLFADSKRWIALGNMANNQSVVHNQQSTGAAALVEKFTNPLLNCLAETPS